MDPEQTFIRVQERFSQMLSPRVRAALEYIYLFVAITLFCILVVMHANYVQQPGCSRQLSGVETSEAQLIYIKITCTGLLSQNESEPSLLDISDQHTVTDTLSSPDVPEDGLPLAAKIWSSLVSSSVRKSKLISRLWSSGYGNVEPQGDSTTDDDNSNQAVLDGRIDGDEPYDSFSMLARESFKAFALHLHRKWNRRISFIRWHGTRLLGIIWNIAGIHLNLDIPKWLRILYLDKLNSFAVQWLERKITTFEPTYLYTMEKGYFLLPEEAKARHNIQTANISISARHACFGNRWQQLLINRVVGYDTILMNSLLNSPGQGYLYNFQTKEFYNLSFAHEPSKGSGSGDYFVTKCGVLMMSFFVFFTTTMSVSFTLRETQTRMLKFTVQLQHHARHRLPTFQLIFVHVIESLVFVPIMIGILFFLFEFYDDQLLAFMVLILVWLCELFTLISVRTPISMKFFPRFFLLYFLVFHIYFFSYAYGFSYLALSTTAAFMQHLILYFWNRFEVPALQRFMQNRRSQMQQQPNFHITSSTILASTLHITRLNTRNPGLVDPAASGLGLRPGIDIPMPPNGAAVVPGIQEQVGNDDNQENPEREGNPPPPPPIPIPEQDLQQPETAQNHPGSMNSFSSLLLWILGGASSEGRNSFFSMFRDQGQFYAQAPRQENHATENGQ